MAITSAFDPTGGILSNFGDAESNTITVSRNAAGVLLVNDGAVPITGGPATVANTTLIQTFGQSGDDTITLSETNGALPRANLFGGAGNDLLSGGSGADQLFGQADNDTLLGKGGADFLFGGSGNDTLTGGDADDQVFGEAGNDRLIWNPGDDSDLFEGGADFDTAEVNGGNGAETFTVTANGSRVRFDRLDPAPFSLDIGTTEALVVNMNGGDDTFSATGNLAALIGVTVDGGAGNDTISGSNGADILLGGDGNDFIDGQQGNDTVFLGAGDDTMQWDPGDGSDVVEGQAGLDTLVFNGSNIAETMAIAANGGRALLSRDVGAITMDLNDVERIEIRAIGGADRITVDDLAGTDVTEVEIDLAGPAGGSDEQADLVEVKGTAGADAIAVAEAGGVMTVTGLQAAVSVRNGAGADDRLKISGGAGNDVIDASGVRTGSMALTLAGEAGDDTLLSGARADILDGGLDTDTASYARSAAGVTVNLLTGLGSGGDAAGDVLVGIENLVGSAAADSLTGNAGGNRLDGGAGADTLAGLGGNDTYRVDDAGDTVAEAAGQGDDTVVTAVSYALAAGQEVETLMAADAAAATAITLTGNEAANALVANAGGNILDGGAGADRMTGLAGDDTYVVDNAGDLVVETANGGTDLVRASVSTTLGDDVENLTLTGAGAIDGTGNGLANVLTGNAGANGLDGGAGADSMAGGAGNDTYRIDVAGDAVFEAAGQGSDTVATAVSYTLAAGQEIETLTTTDAAGLAALALTGNAFANALVGNAGDNVLDGAAGADSLSGLGGNDTYLVDDAGDMVIEAAGQGIDVVRASVSHGLGSHVETLVLTGSAAIDGTGNALDNVLTGNAGANTLGGGDGNDRLTGGAGKDTLLGGAGEDVFDFDFAADSGTGALRDTIGGFQRGLDTIDLFDIDASESRAGNQAFRWTDKRDLDDAFSGRAGELRFHNGVLSGDTDGDGRADFQIKVQGHLGIGDVIL